MRILIVSDIHSNFIAFETVLAAAGTIDSLWCLGDTVGYGPQPNECVATTIQLATHAISGNHDWACIGKLSLEDFNPDARTANEWNGQQLTTDHFTWLQNLDTHIERLDDYENFTFAHGSPREPVWEYLLTVQQARANFESEEFPTQICLIGHSHIPILFTDDYDQGIRREFPDNGYSMRLMSHTRYIINPGSVGQPRNQDPRAAYAILDTHTRSIKFHRVPYDIASTQKRMRDARLPMGLIRRLEYGM